MDESPIGDLTGDRAAFFEESFNFRVTEPNVGFYHDLLRHRVRVGLRRHARLQLPRTTVIYLAMLAFRLSAMLFRPVGSPPGLPTQVRYTGAAFSFNLAGLLGGGLAPIAATALSVGPGTPWGVADHPERVLTEG